MVVTTYLTLVLGELVPKQLALRRPEQIAARLAGPDRLVGSRGGAGGVVAGAFLGAGAASFGLQRPHPQVVTEEELKALVAEGAQAGVLEAEERDMIERVLRLADKPVRAIMTPRTELVWIDRTDPEAEIVATLKAAPYSRFVVCDGSVDNVVGVVQAKDLLDRLLDGGDLSVGAALRQADGGARHGDRAGRAGAAEVGPAGHGAGAGRVRQPGGRGDRGRRAGGDRRRTRPTWRCNPGDGSQAAASQVLVMDGLMPVDEAKARLMLPDLPAEGTYHTLAGLLLALLRRVPRAGDRIVFAGWRFEVLEMDGRRVAKVRASREAVVEG